MLSDRSGFTLQGVLYRIGLMRMKLLLTIMVCSLLALTVWSQDAPVRIQPVPGIEVVPAQPPPNFFPGEDFPEPPDMPPEAWAEPGFGGEMFMPAMPGRFQIVSAQIQQAGKSVPIVLKIDTQTGEVWQLKVATVQRFHNGRPETVTHMAFEPLGQDRGPRHDQGRGDAPRRPNIDRARPDVDATVGESVPVPRFRPQPVPVRPARDLNEPPPRPRR